MAFDRRGSLPLSTAGIGAGASRHATPGPSSRPAGGGVAAGYTSSSPSPYHTTPSPGTPLGAYRLPTTSPPSERLRRLAPKPIGIPPPPPIPLELGGALRRGSRSKGKEVLVRDKEGDHAGLLAREASKAKGARAVIDLRGKSGPERRGKNAGEQGGVVGLGILGLSERTPGVKEQAADQQKCEDDTRPEGEVGAGEPDDLEEFDFAPGIGLATYDPDRASRESSYVSYEETRDASFSTTASFGFDIGGVPLHSSPESEDVTHLPTVDADDGAGAPRNTRPYEYRVASPRSVDARRRAPDVPEAVICPVHKFASAESSRLDFTSDARDSGEWATTSGSGSDDIDAFFLDLRPAAREGDELLSPKAYNANHTPRAVLVQFRDVFEGGDTTAPHLPVGHAPGGPEDGYCFPPKTATAKQQSGSSVRQEAVTTGMLPTSSVPMDRQAPLAASFSETFGIGRDRNPAAAAGVAPAGVVTAADAAYTDEAGQPGRPSIDHQSLRAPSRADSDSSFSFSAYMRSEDGCGGDAESIVSRQRQSQDQARARSGSGSLLRRSKYVDRLMPDLSFGDSPAMEELVTPETRTVGFPSEAEVLLPSGWENSQQSGNNEIGLGLGLGLGLDLGHPTADPPTPTPRYGRSRSSKVPLHNSLRQRDVSRHDATKALKITLNRPRTAIPASTVFAVSSTGNSPSYIRTRRPETSAGRGAQEAGPRHQKSNPNLGSRRPSTAPDDIHKRPQALYSNMALDRTPRLASSASHTSLAQSTAFRKSEQAAGSRSARSVTNAQQARPRAAPDTGFSVDGFGRGKDSRWKGNLKEDAEIDGLAVGRYTTINLWADQSNRESISTLYPIRVHTVARAQRIDAEIGGQISPPPDGGKPAKSSKAQLSPSKNAEDAFYRSGCIEFGMDPRARDKWMFTHGALESWPKLSRLTVNGSQSLDFLSRHASLHVKNQGIYTLRGSEKDGAEWRMRYMVSKGPPCLRSEDRCIVIMALYVNAAFLRGTHASKVGLATSFAKQIKPVIHAVKVSTPELIQASQVPLVPQIQLQEPADPVQMIEEEDVASDRSTDGGSPRRIHAAMREAKASRYETPTRRSQLPQRSTSIRRQPSASPMTPSGDRPMRGQLRPRQMNPSGRRPSTANSSIPHGTPTTRPAGLGARLDESSVATPPASARSRESLMTTVRKRAATVWTRPSTALSAFAHAATADSPVSGTVPPVRVPVSPPLPSVEPPSSAVSGHSFGSALGSLLKPKKSLANLKRNSELDMTPTPMSTLPLAPSKASSPVRPATLLDPARRPPLSAKSVNDPAGRAAQMGPSTSASMQGMRVQQQHTQQGGHVRTASGTSARGTGRTAGRRAPFTADGEKGGWGK